MISLHILVACLAKQAIGDNILYINGLRVRTGAPNGTSVAILVDFRKKLRKDDLLHYLFDHYLYYTT